MRSFLIALTPLYSQSYKHIKYVPKCMSTTPGMILFVTKKRDIQFDADSFISREKDSKGKSVQDKNKVYQ